LTANATTAAIIRSQCRACDYTFEPFVMLSLGVIVGEHYTMDKSEETL